MKTIKSIKEQIEIMTHYLNGGEVECCDNVIDEWHIKGIGLFDWLNTDYRIKEQRKTITIEKWLHEDGRCIEIEKGKLKVGVGSIIIGSYEVEL